MEPSLEDRLAVASALILQSPPGEVNDVFNDLRPIVGDDNQLEIGLLPALSQYNTEQFTLVELPNAKMPAMICPAARLDTSSFNEPEARYLDPNSQQTFIFDHLRLTASDVIKIQIEGDSPNEKIRSELNRETEIYVKSHYQDAFWSVFSNSLSSSISAQFKSTPSPSSSSNNNNNNNNDNNNNNNEEEEDVQDQVNPILPFDEEKQHQIVSTDLSSQNLEDNSIEQEGIDPVGTTQDAIGAEPLNEPTTQQPSQSINETKTSSNKFQLYIVGNKYNPSNYWTGRWRSNYEIDMNSNQIKGHIQVNVHYYEQGNVQLTTNYEPIIEISTKEETESEKKKIKEILKLIERIESNYQNSLNSSYTNLSDNTFKQLRRALPVTKQKINWNNIKTRIVLNDN